MTTERTTIPGKDSIATYVPMPVAWSNAAVNTVAARPAIPPPSNVVSIVAAPTGVPVVMAGVGTTAVGAKFATVNAPVALMGEILTARRPAGT